MGSLRDFLEERRLVEKPLFPSFPSIRRLPGILFFSLFASLPFVFLLLQLHEEEMRLKGMLESYDVRVRAEQEINRRLKKEIHFLQDPRFLEFKIMEELGVIPRGGRVIAVKKDSH